MKTLDCGELNSVAVEWIARTDIEMGRHFSASSLAEFDYQTNLTEHNQRQVLLSSDVFVNDIETRRR